jgi:prevent-host-death family protein
MESVDITQLREQLSQYVALARAGETIVITDRGQEVAELVPLSPARQAIARLVERGVVKWSGGKPIGLVGIPARGAPASDAVIEDRR